jgi:hypothetical protein
MRCRREVLQVRPGNVVAWEVFTILFGETAGFSDNPIDISAAIALVRAIVCDEIFLETLRRIKILSQQYRIVRKAERDAEAARAGMLDDLMNFTGKR